MEYPEAFGVFREEWSAQQSIREIANSSLNFRGPGSTAQLYENIVW
jgi:hypothetical protein